MSLAKQDSNKGEKRRAAEEIGLKLRQIDLPTGTAMRQRIQFERWALRKLLRVELLNGEIFYIVKEAQIGIER